jgi:hypothetical protein
MPDSPAFRHLQKRTPWKANTLHVHTAFGEKTPCTLKLLVVERHYARPYCWLWKDVLHLNTVGGGKTPPVRPYRTSYMVAGGVKTCFVMLTNVK